MSSTTDQHRDLTEPTRRHTLWNGHVTYALRTAVAAIGALYTAMWLQLDVPRWAIWTVVVVSPPVRGDILRKTAARITGTPIGCIVAIVLAGLFPQDRVGYVLGLALWIGLCGYLAARSRGYIAYGAVLAGFTGAIVAGDTTSQPSLVFWTAINRGTATMIGILFALLAEALPARTDDAPAALVDRVCDVAGRLLDWACERLKAGAVAVDDAPLTGPILDLETDILNAFAERPSLRARVRRWVSGMPTALLSIQLATLEVCRNGGDRDTDDAQAVRSILVPLRELVRPGSLVALSHVRTTADRLVSERPGSPASTAATNAAASLLAGIEATLTLRPPTCRVCPYPPLVFVVDRRRAWAALLRSVIGVVIGFLIWDATAWPAGPVFLLWVAVALVLGAGVEDSVGNLRLFFLGNLVGIIVGISALYLLLPWSDRFEWLALVLIVLLGIGVWAETFGPTAGIALGYCNGLLLAGINPANPQHYNLEGSINDVSGLLAGMAFASVLFLLIGALGTKKEQVRRALDRMRFEAGLAMQLGFQGRENQFARESRMCDDLRRVQVASEDAGDRRAAVNLLLACRGAFTLRRESTTSFPHTRLEENHVSLAASRN
jgi:uncharacterized membrane protein YccC